MIVEGMIISVDRSERGLPVPYHRQIYGQIRAAILSGRLRPGDRLPATRDLARQLGLARNTVVRAYEDLAAEGYLESQVGSGTRVPVRLAVARAERSTPADMPTEPSEYGLSAWARRVLVTGSERAAAPALPYDFRPGVPDWSAFPRTIWLRALGRALREKSDELVRYGEPAGYFPLRQAIARHLAVSRGVRAAVEQVVIVSGAQQALDLLIRLRVDAGDVVAMEEPGYPEARQAFIAAGARVRSLPVDNEGLQPERLREGQVASLPPRLVYVTPSHQFPTGVTLTLERRLALLDWARQVDTLLVEDDYDSEFRYAGRPVESLQGLDKAGRVAYVGTFSTVLFPPFRIGYVVLPEGMMRPFVRAKHLADRQSATLEQIALASFIEEGHFERHLRRMRRLAAQRREAMVVALKEQLGIEVAPPETGMHLLVALGSCWAGSAHRSAEAAEAAIVAKAAGMGVGVYPGGPCWAERCREPSLLLGYAALGPDQIREGIRRLAVAIRRARAECAQA